MVGWGGWLCGRMVVWGDGWVEGWFDGLINGWDGWMDGRMEFL